MNLKTAERIVVPDGPYGGMPLGNLPALHLDWLHEDPEIYGDLREAVSTIHTARVRESDDE